MHTVIETPAYLDDAKAGGISGREREMIVNAIADAPKSGDVIKGTGGARKVRIGGKGKGKSKRGGYRVDRVFADKDIPVLLLAVISKSDRVDLSQAERNALKIELSTIARNYRAKVAPVRRQG